MAGCEKQQRGGCCVEMQNQKRRCMLQLSAMINEEDESRTSQDHQALRDYPNPCSPNLIWREKVSQWCYDVVDHLGESRDVVYLAMNVLDRYCIVRSTSSCALNERDYEIASMTALFLAVRVSGRAALEIPQVMRMSRIGVRVQEILDIGKDMTESLSWERRLFTPLHFVRTMVDLLNVSRDLKGALLDSASYLVEVSVCDAFFSGMHPFKVACAAVFNAIGSGSHSRLSEAQRNDFNRRISTLHDAKDEIDLFRLRLYHIYSQSEENLQSSPHVILDDGDDESVVVPPMPRAIRVVASELLLDDQQLPTSTKVVAVVEAEESTSKRSLPQERAVSPTPTKKLRRT